MNTQMTHAEKIDWMVKWCHKHGVVLELNGEVGFGRECVGITSHDSYPEYEWYDGNYERCDSNGDIWVPTDAYHKHECVAVLGRGEEAECQLYEWLKWFDDNKFKIVTERLNPSGMSQIEILLGKHIVTRMVKSGDAA